MNNFVLSGALLGMVRKYTWKILPEKEHYVPGMRLTYLYLSE